MSCEKNIASGLSPQGGAAVITSETKQPITYFGPTDWEVGGENPFRAAIEERKRAMMEHPTFFQACSGIV